MSGPGRDGGGMDPALLGTIPEGQEPRRSGRLTRPPARYEPQEHPLDDYTESEDGSDDDTGSEGISTDDDDAGSLRDFVKDDGAESEGEGEGEATDTEMMEDGSSTEDDGSEMDWSPGESGSDSGSDDGSGSEDETGSDTSDAGSDA